MGMKTLFLIVFLAAPVFGVEKINGPEFGFDASQTAGFYNPDTGIEEGRVSHEGFYANLFFPLEWKSAHLTFVPKIDFYHQRRHQQEVSNPILSSGNAMNSLSTLATGLFLIREKADSFPEIVLGVSRYGGISVGPATGALWETILGATFSDLRETFLGLRWRHYPGYDAVIPLIFKRFDFENGFYVDGQIPAHLFVGWANESKNWDWFGGIQLGDIQFPHDTPLFQGWLAGYTFELVGGMRKNISSVFYGLLEVGVQQELVQLVKTGDSNVAKFNTGFQPLVRLSLQTWFDKMP